MKNDQKLPPSYEKKKPPFCGPVSEWIFNVREETVELTQPCISIWTVM